MQELEVTQKRVVSIWWLVMWRGAVGAVLIGSICGVIGWFLGGIIVAGVYDHAPPDVFKRGGQIAGLVLTIPANLLWGITVVRMAFGKRYRDFRLALIPLDGPEAVKL